MTNKEWLSSLLAEDFYDSFKKAEAKGKFDINTRLFMIEWLDEEHTKNDICCNCSHYEGVHGCEGHAPCVELKLDCVMWYDHCPKFKQHKNEQK